MPSKLSEEVRARLAQLYAEWQATNATAAGLLRARTPGQRIVGPRLAQLERAEIDAALIALRHRKQRTTFFGATPKLGAKPSYDSRRATLYDAYVPGPAFAIYPPCKPGLPWLAVVFRERRPTDTFACPSRAAAEHVLRDMEARESAKNGGGHSAASVLTPAARLAL